MFTITDAIRHEVGSSLASMLPKGAGWRKLDRCLFCGQHKTAAVNHSTGWYVCHHSSCKKRLSAASVWAVNRFGAQIGQAARNVRARGVYGKWVEQWEGEQVAAERVMIYAGEPRDGDADAGKLADWELDVNGDPNQLDRYVLNALNRDLLDYAKAKVRRARRQLEGQPGGMPAPGSDAWAEWIPPSAGAEQTRRRTDSDRSLPDLGFSASDYPFLYAREVEGYTVMELAAREGVSPRTVKRQTRAERARLEAIRGEAA